MNPIARILATGRYIPERRIDNAELERILGLVTSTSAAFRSVRGRRWKL